MHIIITKGGRMANVFVQLNRMFDFMNIVRKHKILQKNEGQVRKSETVHTTLK